MLRLAEEFELGAPSFDRWMKLRDTYQRTLERQGSRRATSADGPPPTAETSAVADRMTARVRARSLLGQAASMKDEPDRADTLYRQAVESAPDDATVLGGYGWFSHVVRHEYERAEDLYRRALGADPTHANNLGNYARLLFVLGRHGEASVLVARAVGVASAPELRLELDFYRYAHMASERDEALALIHHGISQGDRSPGWDLSENVDRAVRDGHPEPELLADLANVIADEVPADVLNQYGAWRAAAE